LWRDLASETSPGARATSLYEAGPTRRWLKVKQHGWTDAEDRWQRRISAAQVR